MVEIKFAQPWNLVIFVETVSQAWTSITQKPVDDIEKLETEQLVSYTTTTTELVTNITPKPTQHPETAINNPLTTPPTQKLNLFLELGLRELESLMLILILPLTTYLNCWLEPA